MDDVEDEDDDGNDDGEDDIQVVQEKEKEPGNNEPDLPTLQEPQED